MNNILITGTAGFIGFHLVSKILERTDWQITGLDNLNQYYDIELKYSRLEKHGIFREYINDNSIIPSTLYPRYNFIKLDLTQKEDLIRLFDKGQYNYVINLAAQAGVRYSLIDPNSYIQSNIVGFLNILEACKSYKIRHLIYASSSSVYGLNDNMPLSTYENVDHPISLYAATKKSNELMAHTYSYLFRLPTTGLRFFTVYGPWGRPDMAYYKFTNSILKNEPISVYNNGNMVRDFTYIDDITEGMFKLITVIPSGINEFEKINPSNSTAPYKIYNIGNSSPIKLLDFIQELEDQLSIKALKVLSQLQAGDVLETHSDITDLFKTINYKPRYHLYASR